MKDQLKSINYGNLTNKFYSFYKTRLQNINCITHGYETTNPNITCFLLIYNKMDFSEFIKIDNIYL